MIDRFNAGVSYPEYLETVHEHAELWRDIYKRAKLPADVLEAARALPGGRWCLLALSEDWCGDAVNILPIVARLAEGVPNLELRVLSRDENLDIMDAHLTNGTSRSIPIVILLDEDGREHGWWGPRPRELQKWVMAEGRHQEQAEMYKTTRAFYAKDKGKTIAAEIMEMIRRAGTDSTSE